MTLRIAIVGCGKAADNHVLGIARSGNAKLVAVCDPEPLMAEQFAVRHRVDHVYTDFSELLAEIAPNVVHITSPPQSHSDLAIKAMQAGSHVFVEKPLAVSFTSASDVVRCAENLKKKLTVGWGYYFDPVSRNARRLVRDGRLGDIVHIESFLSYDLKGAFGRAMLADSHHWIHQLPNGLFHNNLDHLLNTVCELVEDIDPAVVARAWHSPRLWEEPELLDELRVSVFGRKVSANITFSSHCRPLSHSVSLRGTRASAFLDLTNQVLTTSSNSSLPGALGRLSCSAQAAMLHARQAGTNVLRFLKSDLHYLSGLNFLIAAFYDSVVADLPVPISYDHLLRVSWLIDNIIGQTTPVATSSK